MAKAEKPSRCAALIAGLGCMWAIVGSFTTGLATIHDDGKWGRKVLLYATLYITFTSLKWAFEYTISQSGKPGVDTAAVLVAVMGPISALQGFVFRFYLSSASDSERIAAGQPPVATGGTVNVTASA